MTHWFTADTHFGHASILKHEPNRPGKNVEEHDEILIRNWNSIVKNGDIVHHAGDFAWHSADLYLKRLNGQVHLTNGNHDRLTSEQRSLFASVNDISKVKVGEQLIYLCHYAMRVWNRSHYGSWMLYGHSHGSLPDDPSALSIDVGVDCHNYRPISYEEIVEIMRKKVYVPKDHHSPR